jgi:A/G-specific adenine glycosylase
MIQKFQRSVLSWYRQHGRKDLPWQKDITPYRVWISEIMLQQTQVKTVISYFKRFVKRFPHIELLARSHFDEVLHLWAGLGYYTRARNIHRTANILVKEYRSIFPTDLKQLQSFPGIGRSTAGAILSLGMNQCASILDGNVKRLLLRYHAIRGSAALSHILKQLWHLSERYTPKRQCRLYNQAIMDLGAMICTPRDPSCHRCPLRNSCQAFQQDRVADFPYKSFQKILQIRSMLFLLIRSKEGFVLLEKRPLIGIWAGLWCFPQCSADSNWQEMCERQYGCRIKRYHKLPIFRHTLTHVRLNIQPVLIEVDQIGMRVMENRDILWCGLMQPVKKGVPRPVEYLLEVLQNESNSLLSEA